MIAEMMQDNMMLKVMQEPLWLQAWVGWMMLLNTAALLFLRTAEGRVVLACWIANIITMSVFYELFGYVRLLGLSHVIWWTPLVIYLFARRSHFPGGALGVWLWMLLLTNTTSLVIDYIDVFRYFMGDGALD